MQWRTGVLLPTGLFYLHKNTLIRNYFYFPRQAQYLFNPGVTLQSTEQSIAGTVTHEIAHMWFGDIVTLEWFKKLSFFFIISLILTPCPYLK